MGVRVRTINEESVRRILGDLVARIKGEYEACENKDGRIRLYYIKPGPRQRVGRVKLAERLPRKEWRPVTHVHISSRWTEEELEQFLYMSLSRIPLLRGPITD